MPGVGAQVWLERRKWPDSPHYGVQATVLGEDEHGVWVGSRPGGLINTPDGTEWRGERCAVFCVPRDGWFLLHFWDGHPEVAIYVDICTPSVWNERGARTIDLDLDVIVWTSAKGGHVELVDEDEFEAHRVALAYPEELTAAARLAATDVLARVQAEEPPFSQASVAPWLARLLATA